jgi:hypothetical protein
MNPAKQNIIKQFGKEPETLDELAQCVIKMSSGIPCDHNKDKISEVVGFAWDISYDNNVSNSHNSPYGCLTNWGGDRVDFVGKILPTGYEGFSGRVWIRFKERICSSHTIPRQTLTYTGTGGAGSSGGPWAEISSAWWHRYGYGKAGPETTLTEPWCLSWDYKIFLLDWPLIAKCVELEKVWVALNDKPFIYNRKFKWEDPATKASDEEFIKQNRRKIPVPVNA